jgi:hypothetical protein
LAAGREATIRFLQHSLVFLTLAASCIARHATKNCAIGQ